VPTNQQRREAERRRLQRQLEERRAREDARKRTTLIASVIGTLVVIALVIVIVVVSTSGSDKKNTAGGDTVSSPAASTSASSSAPAITTPTAPCAGVPKGTTATFKGVTVKGATDLKHEPKVTSLSESAPKTVVCQDLVVGKGKAATPTSTVTVQYTGVLYKNGTLFDSSWTNGGKPVQFSLEIGPQGVIPGFSQGIGGAGKVAPMHEGGRRLMILPAALAYGSTARGSIPANAPLVFVVDLKSVDG
jgi:peptidylprolyl isomerase